MSLINFTTEFDDRRLVLHFDKLPTALKTNLREAITSLTNVLLARVRAAEPSRTGRLRLQTRAFVDEKENSITGHVRVLGSPGQSHNVAAAALEYGAHRVVHVRAYQRRTSIVSAYQRKADITALRFLRGPAEAMREQAVAELQRAVDKAIEESAQ